MWSYAELPTTFDRINMYGGSWPLKLCAMVPFLVQNFKSKPKAPYICLVLAFPFHLRPHHHTDPLTFHSKFFPSLQPSNHVPNLAYVLVIF